MKHSDVQRGIEPDYQSVWPMDPACGSWENAAAELPAESKQISGLVTPRVFCWLLALGNLGASLRFHTHPLTPCTIQVGGSPMVSAMLLALASAWGGVCNLRGTFRGVRWHQQ
jgi:hypothetical protein